jgi:hypothetical protein
MLQCKFLASWGDSDEAIRQAQRAVELNPGFPGVRLCVGSLCGEERSGSDRPEGRPQLAMSILARNYALAAQTDEGKVILQTLIGTGFRRVRRSRTGTHSSYIETMKAT